MKTNQSISFFQIFWPAVSSLIVALILFLIGLLVDRRNQKKKQGKLYISVLRSIHYDYKKNLGLLCQLHAYLFVRILPSFTLELSRKDELLKTLIPICLNFNLLDHVSDGYFELVHIQRRLDQVIQSYQSTKFESLLFGAYSLINIDIRKIFGVLSEIIEEVNKRSDKSEGIDKLPEHYLTQKFEEFQNNPDISSTAKDQHIDLSKRDRFDSFAFGGKTQASGSFGNKNP